jgi:GT2 family glycosyltransferase
MTNKRHAVLMFMFNQNTEQLQLSKESLESVCKQDIGPLDIFIVNNGSTEPTRAWLAAIENNTDSEHWFYVAHYEKNESPVRLSNKFLEMIFATHDKVFCIANDVIVPSNAYRLMSQWPRGMVTASETQDRNFTVSEEVHAVSECTPMSLALIRRWFYEALMARDGFYLDPRFVHYTSDCDIALRMASCGIRGVQLDLQFYHYGSASWRMNPFGAKAITDQADRDRTAFEAKWKFKVDAYEYGARAGDINFKG